MTIRRLATLVGILCTAPAVSVAQTGTVGELPDITGTYEVDTPDGRQELVIRPDSSASFGEETVRWRMVADTIFIAFGDEWIGYNYVVENSEMTLSGGDLEEPVTLDRIGPPSPRPAGVEVPPAPPFDRRAEIP